MKADIWCVANEIDRATATATGAVPGFWADRVKDPRRGKTWRPAVPTDTLTLTLPETAALDVLAVSGPTFNSGTRFDLRMGSSVGASDAFDGEWAPAVDPASRLALWIAERDWPGDPPAVREIEIGSRGQDIGRVWAGAAHWRPFLNHVSGSMQGVEDLSSVQHAYRSGAVFADSAARMRTHEVHYEAIQPDEWNGPVRDLAVHVGVSKQLLFIPDHDFYPPELHAILGYQTALNPITALIYRRFDKVFALRESG